MSRTLEERVAVLEQITEQNKNTLQEVKLLTAQTNIAVNTLSDNVSKQKGFIGGVLFILVPFFTFIATFAKEIYESLTT
jgi:hypothetical protein